MTKQGAAPWLIPGTHPAGTAVPGLFHRECPSLSIPAGAEALLQWEPALLCATRAESQEWAPAQPLERSLPSPASRGAQGCDSSHSTGLKITTLVPQLTPPQPHLAQSTAGASSKHKQTPRDRAWAALAEPCTVLFVGRTPRAPLQDSIPTSCC